MKIVEKMKAKQANIHGEPPVTIAFLGDSVTQGCFEIYKTGPESLQTVFEPQHAYSTKLRQMLAILYPSVQVNIINSGISGDNVLNGVKRLERDILSYNPDLVVVSYGLNDSGYGDAGIRNYADALATIFDQLTSRGIEVIFLTENMMNTNVSCHITDPMFLRIAEDLANRQNSGLLDRYFEAAKETAAAHGVTVCDCYAKWKAMAAAGVNVTELLANKVNHPIRELTGMFAYSLLETMLA